MHSSSYIVRTSALVLCLVCSACINLQQQLDAQSRDLEQTREQLNRLQAATHSDLEQLRTELSALSGSLEESNVLHSREILDVKERIDRVAAMVKSPPAQTAAPAANTDTASTQKPLVDSEQTHYDRALQLYYERNYAKSRSSFQAFLKQYPGSPLAQNAFFWNGMCLFKAKNYRASIAAFEDLIKKFPQGNKVPDAYYWQALAFVELEDRLTAQILLETLIQTHPDSQAARKAQTKYRELTLERPR